LLNVIGTQKRPEKHQQYLMRKVVIKTVAPLKQAVNRLLKVNLKDCAFPNGALMFPRARLSCISQIRFVNNDLIAF
jgi:hypothetical protein